MSAPAEALTRFWATLREKSRVRIEHPDLPAQLQSATGDLAAALWTRVVNMMQDQLAAAQLEAQRSVADALARQAQAEAERDQLRQELTGSAAALDGAQTASRNWTRRWPSPSPRRRRCRSRYDWCNRASSSCSEG